jgi:hypothetical protein
MLFPEDFGSEKRLTPYSIDSTQTDLDPISWGFGFGEAARFFKYIFLFEFVQTATDPIPWMLEFGRGSFLTLSISFLLVPTALDPVSLRAGAKKSTSRPIAQHNPYFMDIDKQRVVQHGER